LFYFSKLIFSELVFLFRDRVAELLHGDKGVVAFEYLLVIGGVSVAIIAAVAAGGLDGALVDEVIFGVCTEMAGVVDSLDCGDDPSP
jgi:hypothetical protein